MKLIYLLLLLGTALISSCTDDTTPANQLASAEISVRFSLSVEPIEGEVNTRSTDTLTVDESRISNLWVLQFQNGILTKKIYRDSVNVSDVRIPLTSGKSNLYFIVNISDTTFNAYKAGTTTEESFKTASQKSSSEQAALHTPASGKRCIPMYGEVLERSITSFILEEAVNINLTRLLARIDFTWIVDTAATSQLTLVALQICNIPNSMQYYTPQTAFHPVVPEVINYTSSAATNKGGRVTFYLPENLRGKGGNTVNNYPRGKVGVPYATYILLMGYNSNGKNEIRCNIYPGADNFNDYNIKRNTHYHINVNIKGVSSTDARILNTTIIEAAGLLWAPGNLIYSQGTYAFAFTQESYSGVWNGGDYFCWNTLHPTAIDSTNKTELYDVKSDPCQQVTPTGFWRMPTVDEFTALINTGSIGTTKKDIKGRYFGTSIIPTAGTEDNYVFLPNAKNSNNGSMNVTDAGYYWSAIPDNSGGTQSNAYSLFVTENDAIVLSSLRNTGCTVRCVLNIVIDVDVQQEDWDDSEPDWNTDPKEF